MRRKFVMGSLACAIASALAGLGGVSAGYARTNAASGSSGKITVGSIQGSQTPSLVAQDKAGIAAAVKAIRAAGGPKIVVKYCDDKNDANTAQKCATDFANDAAVVAIVGTNTNFGDTVNPALESATLASVGPGMYGLTDFKSTAVFPADGGSITGIAAAGPICLNDLKGKSVSVAYLDVAAGAQVITVMDQFVLKPFDKKLTTSVPIPATAADLSSQAAQLVSDNADCIVEAVPQEQATQLTKALVQQGYKGKIFISGSVHSAASLKAQMGDAAKNVVLVGSYDLSSAEYKQFVKDMKASGNAKSALITDLSAKAWLSVKIAADELQKAATKDRAGVSAALAAETGYDTKGMLSAPLDYTARKPNPAVFGGLAPNVILPYAIGYTYKNGKAVPVTGEWQNAFGGPA
jgi:branched-chain amino acid transport system substrate-binding protein